MADEYQRALSYIFDRLNYEKRSAIPYDSRNYRLERMTRLLELLGRPDREYPIIHIAGTKGKGSVAHLSAAILSASGKRVGLYTSPHLLSVRERFVIDGRPCEAADFVEATQVLRQAEQTLSTQGWDTPTFFEVTTALAFWLFARLGVDVGVIEVGMGGRLDSTNVAEADVGVITSISFDHEEQLGNTLRKIATEKAGIIKSTAPIVCGVDAAEPLEVIVAKADELSAPLLLRDRDWHLAPAGGQSWNYRAAHPLCSLQAIDALEVGMLGRHQAINAATSIAAVDVLATQRGWPLAVDAVRSAVARTQVPARIQQFPGQPPIIVDAGHNVASIAALVETLSDYRRDHNLLGMTVILATSSDKNYREVLRILLPHCDRLICTQYGNNSRSLPCSELYTAAQEVADTLRSADCSSEGESCLEIRCCLYREEQASAALDFARLHTPPDHLLAITGSFFLAAEVLPHLPMVPSLSAD